MADPAPVPSRRARRCPVCGQPVSSLSASPGAGAFPFCSGRCRQVDLGRWFSEQYAVPAAEEEPPAEEA